MAFSTNIYSALSARAYAEQSWPNIGFNDQAARALAKLLGVTAPLKNDPVWERHCLLRSQWFDERCRQFFKRYPQAMCIDLGAGLSTRFHRLSESDDWPRFSWVDVDLPDITALKAKVIPQIDNYRLISANIIKDDWLSASGWHPRTPLIITLESVLQGMNSADISAIFSTIAKHCAAGSNIEIVFDYPRPKARWYQFLTFDPYVLLLQNLRHCLASLGLVLEYTDYMQTVMKAKTEQFFVCSVATPKDYFLSK